eukprot:IDg22252t1
MGSASEARCSRALNFPHATLKWQGSVEHVTCMCVVNAAGRAFTPVFVLPGVLARFRRRGNGGWETPADFLPKPNHLHIREVAGMYSDLFYIVGQQTITLSSPLCLRTQATFYSLWMSGSLALSKTSLERFLAGASSHKHNEKKRHLHVVRNATDGLQYDGDSHERHRGFRGSGLWVDETHGPDQSRINTSAYTCSASEETAQVLGTTTRSRNELLRTGNEPSIRVETAKQLYALYLSTAEKLLSDGTVVENGMAASAVARDQRRVQRALESVEKIRRADESEETNLQKLKSLRADAHARARVTRAHRRARAASSARTL